jgi:predicted nucleotidyltransferase
VFKQLIKILVLYLLISTLLLKKLEKPGIQTSTSPLSDQGKLSPLSADILLSLLYFDIFNYPLTQTEITWHSTLNILIESGITNELEILRQKKYIDSLNGFFFLPAKSETVERRILGNLKATQYIEKAKKISSFISAFPFVRGIFLSGSVSKGYADKDSDIDYFIVTSPGRLWLARTLLILFKKIFLLNSRKYFCLNYFIDTDHLEIPDRNIFTAVELNYLLPTYNQSIYHRIRECNEWTRSYLPNFMTPEHSILPVKKIFIKNFSEKIFGGSLGNKLDDLCLYITEKFWNYKFRKTSNQPDRSIRCQKHVSKFHPQSFHKKVMESYENKILEFEQTYKISLR